jgi:hypothetical protein
MSIHRFNVAIVISVIMLGVSGCSHRLIADRGQRSVRVYQDEEVYNSTLEIQRAMKGEMTQAQRGFIGMVAGVAQTESREADDGTRVAVISQDSAGSQVELLEGSDKGYKGFVPQGNLR